MQECIKKLGSIHLSDPDLHNNTATLIISNDEMENIMKILKSLEDFGFLLKGVSETIQNEVK